MQNRPSPKKETRVELSGSLFISLILAIELSAQKGVRKYIHHESTAIYVHVHHQSDLYAASQRQRFSSELASFGKGRTCKKKFSLYFTELRERLRLPAGHTDFVMTKGAVGGTFY